MAVQLGYYKDYPDRSVVKTIDEKLDKEKRQQNAGNNEIDARSQNMMEMLNIGGEGIGISLVDYAYFIDKYGHKEISDIARECFKRHGSEYIRYLISTAFAVSKEAYRGKGIPETPLDNLKCGNAMMISALQGLVMLLLWIRRKRPPWLHMGLFAYTFPVIWSSFFVTNAEFMRVTIYAVPPVYISLALFAEWYLSSRKVWKERCPAYAADDI